MVNTFDEIEAKFENFQTKIDHKINQINNLHTDQIVKLNEKFNIEYLFEKYSNQFNLEREEFLSRLSQYL